MRSEYSGTCDSGPFFLRYLDVNSVEKEAAAQGADLFDG
jgi:hypothetical protein